MQAIRLETAAAGTPPFYLGRQPILDRDGRTVAYELLFRPNACNGVHITDNRAATASVIAHAFSDLGIAAALGGCQGFINFDAELLLSDVPELLPASDIVIEILETVELTPEVIERCHELKRKGFSFALDDVVRPAEMTPEVLGFIDIVKVDIAATSPRALHAIATAARAAGVRLLAEKVDNVWQAERCKELGFDLFQGYYFARPALLEGRRTQPDREVLLQLLQQIAAEAPREEIEQTFKHAPELAFKLMRLVNSVGMGMANRIQSLGHALVVLGDRQLHRWLQVLLFAHHHADGTPTALMTLAATRGRLMELIAEHTPGHESLRDQAFITGIMSLLDALLDSPMEEILQQVNLGLPIHEALLARRGPLGEMLALVESLEQQGPVAEQPPLADAGWPLEKLPALQVIAMTWASQLGVMRE